jgi:hypothetical protein
MSFPTKSRLALAAFAAVFVLSCGVDQNADSQSRADALAVSSSCVKIEGSDIGLLPQTISVGGVSVTLTGWTAKDGSPGEYVGFALTSAGTFSFTVKAGTSTFGGSGTSWVNPNGTSGKNAKGISNITFCLTSAPPPIVPDAGTTTPPIVPDAGTTTPPIVPDAGTTPPTEPPCADAGTPPPPPPPEEPCVCGYAIGHTCAINSDCAQNSCLGGVCSLGGHGVYCTMNNQCLSGTCSSATCTDPNPAP